MDRRGGRRQRVALREEEERLVGRELQALPYDEQELPDRGVTWHKILVAAKLEGRRREDQRRDPVRVALPHPARLVAAGRHTRRALEGRPRRHAVFLQRPTIFLYPTTTRPTRTGGRWHTLAGQDGLGGAPPPARDRPGGCRPVASGVLFCDGGW